MKLAEDRMRAIAFDFQWPCRLLEAIGRAFVLREAVYTSQGT
jgi:hypothetical protein